MDHVGQADFSALPMRSLKPLFLFLLLGLSFFGDLLSFSVRDEQEGGEKEKKKKEERRLDEDSGFYLIPLVRRNGTDQNKNRTNVL